MGLALAHTRSPGSGDFARCVSRWGGPAWPTSRLSQALCSLISLLSTPTRTLGQTRLNQPQQASAGEERPSPAVAELGATPRGP